MTIFNVRLGDSMQAKLAKMARQKRVNKSEIVREALSAYFREDKPLCAQDYEIEDDWSEFGDTVLESQRKIISRAMERLSEDEWSEAIEPVYRTLREKVIQKSRAYATNPAIYPRRVADSVVSFHPEVVTAIGLPRMMCMKSGFLSNIFFSSMVGLQVMRLWRKFPPFGKLRSRGSIAERRRLRASNPCLRGIPRRFEVEANSRCLSFCS